MLRLLCVIYCIQEVLDSVNLDRTLEKRTRKDIYNHFVNINECTAPTRRNICLKHFQIHIFIKASSSLALLGNIAFFVNKWSNSWKKTEEFLSQFGAAELFIKIDQILYH